MTNEWNLKINFNDYVKVKLTPAGLKEMEDRRERLNADIITRGGKSLGPYDPKVDKDGYTKFPLWMLMNNLGHMLGVAGEQPIEYEIILKGK